MDILLLPSTTSISPEVQTTPKMSMQLELKDVILRTGDQLKIKGFVLHDADRQLGVGVKRDAKYPTSYTEARKSRLC
ncbi:uncharacterized protein isoform X3 [Takifugu rubripes]|uniref:uncharacterized protein isoform X3 n=1 Tax=Takifugu rubripes TaxID=31033 RepID=UPI0011459AEA|nr:uncharacterized protein LOC115248679 isoform X3 [Takifugu rubripes]XP_029691993.1 uncharacterized protein LOC115249819 isoform X3 [Takifugu rubripes]